MGFFKDLIDASSQTSKQNDEIEADVNRHSSNPKIREAQYKHDAILAQRKVVDKYTDKAVNGASSLLKKGAKAGFNKLKEHHAAQKK